MGSMISCYTKCDSTDQQSRIKTLNITEINNKSQEVGDGKEETNTKAEDENKIKNDRKEKDENVEASIKDGNSQPFVNGMNPPAIVPSSSSRKNRDKDYIFGKVIGEGSFSTVFLAKEIRTNNICAIKVCDKLLLLRERKSEYVKREREALCRVNSNTCPFVIRLYATFQDENRLFFVLSYAKHGELLPFINKVGSFNEKCTQFYAAELLLAIEHIHKMKMIHRDIKPENILLDERMHIQLADFGSVRIQGYVSDGQFKEATRRNSFVGTAQYVAPEILSDKEQSKAVDLWSFGCTIYQMACGYPPFRAPNEYLIFQKVVKQEYSFPDNFNPQIRDLVEKLLVEEPSKRLGAKDDDNVGYVSIRNHQFFTGIDWDSIHLQTPPEIVKQDENSTDFSEEFSLELQPGLDDGQLSRLFGLELRDYDVTADFVSGSGDKETKEQAPPKVYDYNQLTPDDISKVFEDLENWTLHQVNDSWHNRVGKNVILKIGVVSKRKGLLQKPRVLVLTTGPHLYYFSQGTEQPKGEIAWHSRLKAEAKNFKLFVVRTVRTNSCWPIKSYHFEDHNHQSQVWCDWINNLHKIYYPPT